MIDGDYGTNTKINYMSRYSYTHGSVLVPVLVILTLGLPLLIQKEEETNSISMEQQITYFFSFQSTRVLSKGIIINKDSSMSKDTHIIAYRSLLILPFPNPDKGRVLRQDNNQCKTSDQLIYDELTIQSTFQMERSR